MTTDDFADTLTSRLVSLVNPQDLSSIRSSFCNQVDFYATARDARPFLDAHPEGALMAIRDAHDWARCFAAAFVASGQ
jgi:alkylmercury lyase